MQFSSAILADKISKHFVGGRTCEFLGRGSASENPAQVYSSSPPKEAKTAISSDNKVQKLMAK